MLTFSAGQMAAIEDRGRDRMAERARPALVAEFGPGPVARAEPLDRLVRTAVLVRLDAFPEVYRFMRVICALERPGVTPQRRMLVARIAGLPDQPDARLHRMEGAVFSDTDRGLWSSHIRACAD